MAGLRLRSARRTGATAVVVTLGVWLVGCYDASIPGDASAPTDLREDATDDGPLRTCGEPERRYSYLDFDADPDILADCEHFLGSFSLSRSTDVSLLRPLRRIDGSLDIIGMPDLEDLSGLESLEFVGRSLSLFANDALQSLTALSRLRTVGELTISTNPQLRSLRGLDALEEAASLSIVVESGIDLSEFAPRLVRVTYSVWFGADIERAQIDAFLARVEVRGAVYHDGVLIAGTEDAGP